MVAPHRGALVSGGPRARRRLVEKYWMHLVAAAFEDLVRERVPRARGRSALASLGPWGEASRWWHGGLAEWDAVSVSLDGRRLLLGEVKWSARPLRAAALQAEARALATKAPPALPASFTKTEPIRALFVPAVEASAARRIDGMLVVTWSDLIR
jgi:hypothetical protein